MTRVQLLDRMVTGAVVVMAASIFMTAVAGVALAAGGPGGITGLKSTTHPSDSTWYPSNGPSFVWDPATTDGSAIAGYSFVLDHTSSTVPDAVSDRNSLAYLPRVAYGVGSSPAESRLTDLNGDGKLDLVVENYLANTVSVLLGKGDGTFRAAVNYATASGPWSMDIGDVNGDGKTDVVTGNYTASNASVLLGNGDGTLQARVDYSVGTGTNPECLRMGDVNGDKRLDIFTANASTNDISVLLNKGDGTFVAPARFATASHPTSIDLCDLNADGIQDLATANYTAGSVSVLMGKGLLGKGDGTFQPAVNYAVDGNPQMVLATDLNHDGRPDLATVNWTTNDASILLNKGSGTFAAKIDYPIGNGPYAFSVQDLNQDGAPDLVATNHTANSISVLYGNGDGTFAPKIDFLTGNAPYFVALGDLNGDGYGDMVTTDMSDDKVSVFLGTAFTGTSFSGKADGVWYFHVRAVDVAGKAGETATLQVRMDSTAPATTDASSPALAGAADSAWRATAQTVRLQAADGGMSGVARTYYTLDGVQHTYTGPFSVSGNGSHALTYWSADVAGNTETAHSGWVNIDGDAPLSSDASSPALALDRVSGWQHSAQLVTLSAADTGSAPVSGLASVEYNVDGAGYVPYTAPFVVAGEGSHTVLYRAIDKAGNVEAAHTAYVNIDTTMPTITSSADADASWHCADVVVTLSPADTGGSGLDVVQYRAGAGGSWTDVAGGFTVPAAGKSGAATYQYRARDKAGNETAGSFTLHFDTTTPATSDASVPELAADGSSGWQTASQTVTLDPSDGGGSDLAATFYTLDGDQHAYTGPFDVSGDGSHALTYWSTDKAGNVEAAHRGWVNIDATAPASSDASAPQRLAADADSDWRTTSQQVTIDAADADGSGVASIHYVVSPDGTEQTVAGDTACFTVSGDGSHHVEYWAVDAAGNAEASHSGWVNIWATAPVASASGAGAGWLTSDPQTVTLAATGGHGATTIHYTLDGGDQQDVAGPSVDVGVGGEGSHHLVYWASDSLGNTETTHHGAGVDIDTAAPTTGDTYSGGDTWQTGPVSFELQPADSGSGMQGGSAATAFKIDDEAAQSGTDVVLTGDGTHTVKYWSTDCAGNVETQKAVTVRIDAAAPATGDDAPVGWRKADTTVTLTPKDLLSGMVGGRAKTTYEVDGGATRTGTSVLVPAPIDHSGDGVHTITYRSRDAVGNLEADRTATVLVDTLAPVTRDDIAAGPPAHTDPITVALHAADDNGTLGVSGVAVTHYRVDGGSWQTGTSVEVTGDGQHTIEYYSTDNAGNDEAVKTSQTLTIGTTPPGASSDDAPGEWVGHAVTVKITPGARAVRTTWELDGGATQTGTSVHVDAPATHAGDGAHTITYRSSTIGDVAETTRTAVVRVDTTAPHTSDDAPAGWQHGPVTLTLAAGDAASGVAGTTYSIDGGADRHGTSVVVTGDGQHTITYSSVDNAGNVESAQTAVVRIDVTAPQVTCAQAGRWFRTKTVKASFAAGDAGSGLREVACRVDQGAWQAGGSYLVSGLGPHAVSYRATDVCGNVTTGSCVVGIDMGRPTVTRGLPSKGEKTGKLTLRFRVTDPKPSCGAATVTKIVVTTSRGKKVATIAGAGRVVKTNATVTCAATWKLKRGSYRFKVTVVDLAGNTQKKAIAGKLVVK